MGLNGCLKVVVHELIKKARKIKNSNPGDFRIREKILYIYICVLILFLLFPSYPKKTAGENSAHDVFVLKTTFEKGTGIKKEKDAIQSFHCACR